MLEEEYGCATLTAVATLTVMTAHGYDGTLVVAVVVLVVGVAVVVVGAAVVGAAVVVVVVGAAVEVGAAVVEATVVVGTAVVPPMTGDTVKVAELAFA